MKFLMNISRAIVGILFIFSGLIKANDPLGLSYKMQEFFEVWGRDPSVTTFMSWLHEYALPFSIIMITLEVIVGVALLVGIWKKFVSGLLLLLIIFFSFLTGYAVLSGKIATCGCFGDCIPLTAMQSFIKDIVLVLLILLIYFGRKYIQPLFTPIVNLVVVIISTILVLFFQWYVLRHLPVIDCLPFKKGNNILELRKMPADAIPDKKEFIFTYKKAGEEKQFKRGEIPDSTWEFVSREDVIVEKGKNNEPPIKDFYLTPVDGADSTEELLSQPGKYYLLFVKEPPTPDAEWINSFEHLLNKATAEGTAIYVVTSRVTDVNRFFNEQHSYQVPVFGLDATALKTAARTNPQLYLMEGPVVIDKWGWADFGKVVNK